jgi:sterol desaturase/sphingolipid hydroxylase (fatty acid hydroxylase superfamily)
MGPGELAKAYLTHYAILTYLALAAVVTGLLVTSFYELCHCVRYLPFAPKARWLRRIKKLHMAHHLHNGQGNYGITDYLWDRIFGTYYAHPKRISRSETVFDLSYTPAKAERYPWVARLSECAGIPPTAQAMG